MFKSPSHPENLKEYVDNYIQVLEKQFGGFTVYLHMWGMDAEQKKNVSDVDKQILQLVRKELTRRICNRTLSTTLKFKQLTGIWMKNLSIDKIPEEQATELIKYLCDLAASPIAPLPSAAQSASPIAPLPSAAQPEARPVPRPAARGWWRRWPGSTSQDACEGQPSDACTGHATNPTTESFMPKPRTDATKVDDLLMVTNGVLTLSLLITMIVQC